MSNAAPVSCPRNPIAARETSNVLTFGFAPEGRHLSLGHSAGTEFPRRQRGHLLRRNEPPLAVPGRLRVVAQQLCPVIVGREDELHTLSQAFEKVLGGHGQSVVLRGEAGIGKSRLVREVLAWAGQHGVPAVTGRATPSSTATPYRPLNEALLALLRHQALPDNPELARWLPLLQPLLPVVVCDAPTPSGVPASLRGEAILQVLRAVTPASLVVVLEDLHWADPDTLSVADYLADSIDEQPVLLVLTLRDGPASPALELAGRLRGRHSVVCIPLGRLDQSHVAAMVRACDGDTGPEVLSAVAESSEGVPLLVEELLASPGLPADFASAVRARLAEMPEAHRQVIEAASVLGRNFDWRLLGPAAGHRDDVVGDALAAGLDNLLLDRQGSELRFRHALTREAVLEQVVPPRQRQLAVTALRALEANEPIPQGPSADLAIDLAMRAGDRARAGGLLAGSGRQSLAWGALATAVDCLRRAADLLAGTPEQAEVELDLLEALALAGRVDEAAAAGGRLVTRLGTGPNAEGVRLEAHLRLAQAAVAASRWAMARHHLDEGRTLAAAAPPAGLARMGVLEADVAMAAGDYDTARKRAEQVLGLDGAEPAARCYAYEIVGRSRRSKDLGAARNAFEAALITAEANDLPVWRLRALHELGTVDLFDHAGVDRLLQARQAAEKTGAMSTAAVLDLQLSAGYTCRWDLEACQAHAASAVAIAERLGLDQVRAKGLALLTGAASMRGEVAETERLWGLTRSAAPEDPMLEGFCEASLGMALMLGGDGEAALDPYARGMASQARLPHAEPAALRALWPLVLAASADRRAPKAVEEAHRLGVAAFHLNRAMIGYAEAVLAGRRGDASRARELVSVADTGWTNCQGWADLARLLAAPAAAADGWADIRTWLDGAVNRFAEHGLLSMSRRCEELLAKQAPNPWAAAGVSTREAEVLRLVAVGLANKEIATQLHLSPRTVEKHVESLLRKAGARSRTELVARLARTGPPVDGPSATT